jgi:ATP-binding cassette subfamily B protein/subfamily B ATP-binding cassette protein MsbA
VREYLQWLRPHRGAVGTVFVLALIAAGMQLVEPLFMRFMVDRVLMNADLDAGLRLVRLNMVGVSFLALIIFSNLFGAAKDYRQRLLNVGVMLSLRRSLFDRMLHLPLAKLYDMKTGGILSRLSGDIDTTTGLLQLAVFSPSIAVIRLMVAIGILLSLNWRLALMAMAIIPGAMLMSFTAARRIRPIYRSVRRDVEQIDGRARRAGRSALKTRRAGTRRDSSRSSTTLWPPMVGRFWSASRAAMKSTTSSPTHCSRAWTSAASACAARSACPAVTRFSASEMPCCESSPRTARRSARSATCPARAQTRCAS